MVDSPPALGTENATRIPRAWIANMFATAHTRPASRQSIGRMRRTKGSPIANTLLAALPRGTYQRLLGGLEPVRLTFGQILYEPGKPIRQVYFPTDSVVSLLTLVEGHMAMEIGLVGRECMLGVPVALGDTASS